jgi:hypothetical protein
MGMTEKNRFEGVFDGLSRDELLDFASKLLMASRDEILTMRRIIVLAAHEAVVAKDTTILVSLLDEETKRWSEPLDFKLPKS